MATTTPSARGMLLTNSVRPCVTYSPPSATSHPVRHFAAHKHHYVVARTQAQESDGVNEQQPKKSAAVPSAFERAAAYRKSLGNANPPSKAPVEVKSTDFNEPVEGKPSPSSTDAAVPKGAVNLQDVSPGFNSPKSKQESEMASALVAKAEAREGQSGQADTSQGLEVEIITRDGIIRRKVTRPGETFTKAKGPKRTGVSSSDFIGLDFSEKKSSSKGVRPAGLSVGLEPPRPGSLPTVEIITRDGRAPQQATKDALYKPKVVTWGVFERPANISEAYGGGRIIKPGEQLETEEEKKASDARIQELLRDYHKTIGLDVDPQIRTDCGKAFKKGNALFEKGYVLRALEQFEKVMQQMPYQSELHGMTALQWALCMDSSNRFQEAKTMYEKIASHPNAIVRKKAKQLLYGFQAMDKLKFATMSKWDASVYRKYFDAFSDGYNTLYRRSEDEADDDSRRPQDFVYVGILLFPLVLFFLVWAVKGI